MSFCPNPCFSNFLHVTLPSQSKYNDLVMQTPTHWPYLHALSEFYVNSNLPRRYFKWKQQSQQIVFLVECHIIKVIPLFFALKLETWCESLILSLWFRSSPACHRLALCCSGGSTNPSLQGWSSNFIPTQLSNALKWAQNKGENSAMIWLSMCSLMKKLSF